MEGPTCNLCFHYWCYQVWLWWHKDDHFLLNADWPVFPMFNDWSRPWAEGGFTCNIWKMGVNRLKQSNNHNLTNYLWHNLREMKKYFGRWASFSIIECVQLLEGPTCHLWEDGSEIFNAKLLRGPTSNILTIGGWQHWKAVGLPHRITLQCGKTSGDTFYPKGKSTLVNMTIIPICGNIRPRSDWLRW